MRHVNRRSIRRLAIAFACVSLATVPAVLTATDPLPQDRGATGTWQKLLKLRTIASVMHTTAHPDDEHGGLLALLSRGEGARVSLLTLNRGEAGDNAIGPELFDPLGLIRTEELLRADQYYGVDAQYFTSVVDYGFSKRLEEALVKWGRETRAARRRARHPHGAAAGADRALPGERARRPRQPSDGRPDHAGGLQGRGRSERVSRNSCSRDCGRGSR